MKNFNDQIGKKSNNRSFNQNDNESDKMSSRAIKEDQFLPIDEYKNNTNNILVAVRVRPLNTRELTVSDFETLRILDNKFLVLLDPGKEFDQDDVLRKNRNKETQFTFDFNFDKSAKQSDIYTNITPFLIDGILDGFNATIFAYGATGAGKTYTMVGTVEDPGIIPRSINDLMEKIENNKINKDFSVKVSYLEIYNECIKDLLTIDDKNLEIREDPIKGLLVAGITEILANNLSEIMTIMKIGNKNRSKEATGVNDISSRSHAVFQIIVEHKEKNQGIEEQINFAKFTLVDLAGSERAAASSNKGMRMIEGAKINQSLLILGNCIQALSEQIEKNNKATFVPYRGSKLTRLLKDSLGGNCRTVMIANLSPSVICFEDTYNTLNFANRTKSIKTNVIRNSLNVSNHIANYVQIISNLRQENEDLKRQLSNPKNVSNPIQPIQTHHKKNDSIHFQKFEKEIKDHFEEENDVKNKIYEIEKRIEENRVSVLVVLNSEDKNSKKSKEFLDSKKINLISLTKAKEDLNEQYNILTSKRGNLTNSIKQSNDLSELYQNYLILLIRQNVLQIEKNDIVEKESFNDNLAKQKDVQISLLNVQMKIRDQLIEDQQKLLENNKIPNKIPKKFQDLKSLKEITEEAKLLFPPIEKSTNQKSRSPKKKPPSEDIKFPKISQKRSSSIRKPLKANKSTELIEKNSLASKNYLNKKPIYKLFENQKIDQNKKSRKRIGYGSQNLINVSEDSKSSKTGNYSKKRAYNSSVEPKLNKNNRSISAKSNQSLSSTASSKLKKQRANEKYEQYVFDKKYEEKPYSIRDPMEKHFINRKLEESPFVANFKKPDNDVEKKKERIKMLNINLKAGYGKKFGKY